MRTDWKLLNLISAPHSTYKKNRTKERGWPFKNQPLPTHKNASEQYVFNYMKPAQPLVASFSCLLPSTHNALFPHRITVEK